ncbi:MAG: hypothetical protein U9N82_10360, partial [Thermodesulfobacteriota bacterium]|nr:hypothetical protein [Thermodesulfobacteriota bacterium]
PETSGTLFNNSITISRREVFGTDDTDCTDLGFFVGCFDPEGKTPVKYAPVESLRVLLRSNSTR